MGRGSVSSKFLVILNILYSCLGVAISGLSVWFYICIDSLISIRNGNHFNTENSVYWIQVLPWIFTISGVFAILVSCCAFLGVMKTSRPLVLTSATFQLLTIFLFAAAATVSIKYADTEDTDGFVRVTLTDAFDYIHKSNDPELNKAFQSMEVKLQCCGSSGPTSYNGDKWKLEYPTSCCKRNFDENVKSCPKVDEVANTRKGCTDIAIHHVRIAVKIFAAVGIFTAFIGILNLVTALLLANGYSNRKKMMKVKLENSGDVETHRSQMSSCNMATMKMPL